MKRRDVLKAAAILPAAGIMPTEAAEVAQTVHPHDGGLMREIERMEATLARVKRIVQRGGGETPFERAGLHCDARCAIGSLQIQLDMIELESDRIYVPLVRRIRKDRSEDATTAAGAEGLTKADYVNFADSARRKRELISPDTAEGRFRVAYLLRFEETMRRLAEEPRLGPEAAFAADARDRVELARMFGITL